ncbi:MAG TPA: hypothetical protein DDY77_00475 [Clostridiales bacterium]|nr:hypothetical protein [Clostridiales bacterium]
MTDIHAHVVPTVDDGSKSLEDSLSLLKKAEKEGINRMVCTPHFRRGVYEATRANIEKAFNTLVENNPTGVELFLGREITIDKGVYKALKDGELSTMAGSKYVLCEYPYTKFFDIAGSVYELKLAGFKPIIAHIERYEYLSADDVADIRSLSAVIQANASSFFASPFASHRRRAYNYLENDFVDVVSSDIHVTREYNMKRARDFIKKRYGEEKAEKLFKTNADKILL